MPHMTQLGISSLEFQYVHAPHFHPAGLALPHLEQFVSLPSLSSLWHFSHGQGSATSSTIGSMGFGTATDAFEIESRSCDLDSINWGNVPSITATCSAVTGPIQPTAVNSKICSSILICSSIVALDPEIHEY